MGLQGPSGSGKTFGALQIAYGLCGNWKKICLIDSENNAADLYAHLGPYNVLGIEQPNTPEKYIEAIKLAENASQEVIVIDSVSHEWSGEGGIIDIHSNMPGNSFTNWGKLTPRHNSFVQKMLQSDAHIIASIRTKQDYVLNVYVHRSDSSGLFQTDTFIRKKEELLCIKKLKITLDYRKSCSYLGMPL